MNSNRRYHSPFSLYTRVAGRYNTIAPFIVMTGYQESLTGNGDISLECYHTKLYTTDSPITLYLGNGVQDGQLKTLTMVFKGNEEANATVECPSLSGTSTQLVFSNIGDKIELLWNGGSWLVLSTMNTTDPTLQTPVVQ